jgi:hypothetical protein
MENHKHVFYGEERTYITFYGKLWEFFVNFFLMNVNEARLFPHFIDMSFKTSWDDAGVLVFCVCKNLVIHEIIISW